MSLVCTKRPFENKGDADKFARLFPSKRRKQKGKPMLVPYRCDRCGKFHLTSQKRG